ncbi:glycosyltransferase [Ornithinibacillus halophilus]|uniref:Rhamnosyltransferase n=1 Tax=Ornithinibacillus halophilus TaxID=930117 RepID=A0A1M5GIP5_9BACI|nr:glycosyltransferase [Ornithinibacillus halophilus]SHG03402.1 rhamnosyltransferase [Ornithinibacillus halophilus]
MKISIGVVLYYPSITEVNRVINFSKTFSDVYVYDNTPETSHEEYFNTPGIHYYFNASNDGLSVALNNICKNAINHGYNFIITMDQDSIISNESLFSIQEFIKNNDMEKVGIVAPAIIYDHNRVKEQPLFERGFEYIEWTITSGSAVNLDVYKKTSGFDENYFIDRLDYDYCILLQKLNYYIIQLKGVYLYQSLGEQKKGILKNYSTHNPLRHYYMFRNRLYFYFKKQNITFYRLSKLILAASKHLLQIIFIEEDKAKKIRMIMESFKDFINGKMGKYIGKY